jgi:hypothetical protein
LCMGHGHEGEEFGPACDLSRLGLHPLLRLHDLHDVPFNRYGSDSPKLASSRKVA